MSASIEMAPDDAKDKPPGDAVSGMNETLKRLHKMPPKQHKEKVDSPPKARKIGRGGQGNGNRKDGHKPC